MKLASRINELEPSDIRNVMKIIAANPGTISMASGAPDPKLYPTEAIAASTDRILKQEPGVALSYGMTLGRLELREQIAKLMAREGVSCTKDQIMVTTGSQQGLSLAAQLFCDPGDLIVTENPSYLGALSAFKPHEVNYVGIDGDDEGMDLEALEKYLKSNEKVKAIYLVPNFQNPTGKTWTKERRQGLLDIAYKYDLPIIEDNAYGELRYEGERVPSFMSLDRKGQVIHLGSFSKILSPGLRVGWMAASSDLINKLEMLKYGADLQSVELTQMIVTDFLTHNDIDEYLDKIKAVYKKRRDAMLKAIQEEFPPEVHYIRPEGGMFVWVELPEYIDTKELLNQSVERKVAYVPGQSFYPDESKTNTMRLNFSAMEEDKISEGVQILGRLIRELIAQH